MRLNVRASALTCAILCGVGLFLLTWWIIMFDGSSETSTFVGKVYRGYSVTPVGSVVGLAWGIVDGLVGGAVIAWLYNALSGARP